MNFNDFMMYFSYAIVIVINLGNICSFVYACIRRSPFAIISSFAMLIFMVFMDSALIFGGSAFLGNASLDYELYEEGHYYLCNHGNYTEVSYEVYTYMQIIEIVGIVFFAIAFITSMIQNKKETGSFFRYKKEEKQLLGSGWKNPFLKE